MRIPPAPAGRGAGIQYLGRPLRVVLFMHSAELAGAEMSTTRMVLSLDPSRVQVTVLCARPGPLVEYWVNHGLRVEICPQPWLTAPVQQPRLLEEAMSRVRVWLERLEPDVVVCNTSVLYAAAWAAAELQLPLVVWVRAVLSSQQHPWLHLASVRTCERSIYMMASVLVMASQWTARHVVLAEPHAALRVVANGVQLPADWKPLEPPRGPLVFVSLSAIERHKGVAEEIEALAEARRQRPSLDLQLIHYGWATPGECERVQALVETLGLQEAMHFPGATDRLYEVYPKAYAVVVPSDVEPFSNVVIEAMAYGRPVIATRSGGPESIIVDGKTGILVPRQDPSALCRAMLQLADDPEKARAMGVAGRQRAESRYDIVHTGRRLMRVLGLALAQARRPEVQERRRDGLALSKRAAAELFLAAQARIRAEEGRAAPLVAAPSKAVAVVRDTGPVAPRAQLPDEGAGPTAEAREAAPATALSTRPRPRPVSGKPTGRHPLRLAVFVHSANRYGAETAVTRLALALRAAGNDITFLACREGPLFEVWREAGIGVQVCPQPWILHRLHRSDEMEQAIARARACLERVSPDVVISNTDVLYAGARAASEMGLPLVVWSHLALSAHQHPGIELACVRSYQQSLYTMADVVLAPSPWVGRSVSSIVPDARVRVVPNGLTLPENWKPLDADSTMPVFVMLATLEPHKNLRGIVEAAAEARRQRPDVKLSVLHYGRALHDERERTLRLMADLGVTDAVHLKGETDDAADVYRQCYAALVPSDVEPFSLVTIEAMAYGRPVIATRSGGPESIIVDGETGILVPRGDSRALAEAMLALACDPGKARVMGIAGRQRAERHYEIGVVAEQAAKEIVSAIEESTGPEAEQRRRLGLAFGKQAMLQHRLAGRAGPGKGSAEAATTGELPGPVRRVAGKRPLCVLSASSYRLPSVELAAVLPLRELMRQGHCEFMFTLEQDCTSDHLRWCDLLYLVRPTTERSVMLWREAGALGKPMVSFWDDDLINVPDWAPCYPEFAGEEVRQRIHLMLRESRSIWFFNPHLGQTYSELAGRPYRVIPMSVESIPPEDAARHIEDDEVLRVGYAAGVGHGKFVDELCAEALQRALAATGARVELYCFGAKPALLERLAVRSIPYTPYYPDFRRHFASIGLHVGLAPLPEGPFYACKWYTKFLDYASVGACGVFSRVPPFTEVVTDSVNGLLTENEPAQWEAALTRVLTDRALRHRLASEAYRQVLEEHPVERAAEAIAAALAEACGREIADRAEAAPRRLAPTLPPPELRYESRQIHPARPLSGGRRYFIRPRSNGLHGVAVRLGLHQRTARGRLVLSIYADAAAGPPLRRVVGDLSRAADNDWFTFSFAPIANSRGRRLAVQFDLEEPGADTMVSLYEEGPPATSLAARARGRLPSKWGGSLYCHLYY